MTPSKLRNFDFFFRVNTPSDPSHYQSSVPYNCNLHYCTTTVLTLFTEPTEEVELLLRDLGCNFGAQ
jgi:hypothetical protein